MQTKDTWRDAQFLPGATSNSTIATIIKHFACNRIIKCTFLQVFELVMLFRVI